MGAAPCTTWDDLACVLIGICLLWRKRTWFPCPYKAAGMACSAMLFCTEAIGAVPAYPSGWYLFSQWPHPSGTYICWSRLVSLKRLISDADARWASAQMNHAWLSISFRKYLFILMICRKHSLLCFPYSTFTCCSTAFMEVRACELVAFTSCHVMLWWDQPGWLVGLLIIPDIFFWCWGKRVFANASSYPNMIAHTR